MIDEKGFQKAPPPPPPPRLQAFLLALLLLLSALLVAAFMPFASFLKAPHWQILFIAILRILRALIGRAALFKNSKQVKLPKFRHSPPALDLRKAYFIALFFLRAAARSLPATQTSKKKFAPCR